ncbi:hypothetical protein E4U43_006735 [Claviceps pusilla]|uniref:Uncharacterized protein n=1 Tax=Claviceps pusilla TaxID=123648 RepID=A0A9P7NDP7_9HYPO|nr:hypothetical protein E4U43_006735 [Claviceps pusilla]
MEDTEDNRHPGERTPNLKPPNVCWEYERHGRCKFGKWCKYSHGIASNKQHKQELPQEVANFFANLDTTRAKPTVDGKLREWKKLLVRGSSVSRPSPATISRFFVLALELMDGDVGSSQDVIKQMVTEPGLLFIKDVVERHVMIANQTGPSITFWTTEVKPLFQLITHPRVIDSAVLEGQVSSIFNFILGHGGHRMKSLFGYLVKLVQAWPHTSNNANSTMMSAVELSLAVLTKLLDCNTVNVVNETFALINRQFIDVVAQSTSDQESFAKLQSMKYIEYIRRRIEVGNDIIAYQDLPAEPVTREKFVLRRDFPGRLSAEGPRHDNDFDDISKISILPTFEEILSPRAEYLPTNDSNTWHVGGIRGRIDREFRLLREDTVGQLRDAVRDVHEQMKKPRDHRLNTRNHVRIYTYESPTPVNVMFDKDGGLELLVQCEQLTAVQSLSSKERHNWWQQSRRLQAGALVCLIDDTGTAVFFVVSQSTMRTKDDVKFRRQTRKAELPEDGQPAATYTLSDEPEFLYVTLQLAESNDEEIQRLLEWYRGIGSTERKFLVEFPGILLDSFKHTLAALQDIYKRPDVPFSDIVAPPPEATTDVMVQPPIFARRPGFTYNADCLQTGLVLSPSGNKDPEDVASCSSLDPSQSMAIVNTLSRELSLVQGPPGTGKSYTGEKIIQILLENKTEAKLGPIICVCYTNHALDQLLEHLLDKGIEKVIRIGSRSKSERMVNLNLNYIVQAFDKTKSERADIGEAHGEIKRVSQEIVSNLRELAASQNLDTIKDHLKSRHPRHYYELFPPSEDGWTVVSYQKSNSAIHNWLASGHEDSFKYRPLQDLEHITLSEMSSYERTILFENWLREIRDPIISSLVSLHREYRELFERRDRAGCDVKLRCLQQADVIGVTTTGLARNIGLLRRLRSKVMLCEEAGEVLEAHVLTALIPSLEQAILIGDHLQLRPQINNYELQSTNSEGAKYSLDTSLFERLVQPLYDTDPQVPYSTLETQRRMHPSIAALIQSTLYPSLQNAENVSLYPEVCGMRQRLFWFHHENLEAGASTHDPLNTSHSNDFEVEMTTALVSHLIRQGEYQHGQIAVLTPYLGQLHKLRRRMASIFEICINDRDNEGLENMAADNMDLVDQANPANISKSALLKTVRVATVDNFQGEEADVVVISLVRSNPQNKCGFLSTSNRINVLLSRAKHGMYIIGNSNTYRSVPMWQKVIKRLEDEGNFGSELGLQCPRHPETAIHVSQPDDFAVHAPESGCNLPCQMRLRCGHSCSGRCHSEMLHEAVRCLEPCPRSLKGCDHSCPKHCGDVCPTDCRKLVTGLDIILDCGHEVTEAFCFEAQDTSLIRCSVTVTKTVPGCDHRVSVACSEDVTSDGYMCISTCGCHLACGHNCKSPCWTCKRRQGDGIVEVNHGQCKQVCGKKYTACPHSCSETCHADSGDCPACKKKCEVRCSHSRCHKLCHEPCVPCPSICGETCPDSTYCQECASDEIKATAVDFLEMKEYKEIDLDQDPCIFPQCGHFLTVASMDGQMDMSSHYVIDSLGHPVGINKVSEPFSMDGSGVPVCANCRGSLRNIARYGRIVRRATLDEATKKFISWSGAKHSSLASSLLEVESALQTADGSDADIVLVSHAKPKRPSVVQPRFSYLGCLDRDAKNTRYGKLIRHWNKINGFVGTVKKEEQPFQRVADLVRHTNRQKRTQKQFRFDDSVIQVKGFLFALLLRLRCEICIMSDFFFKTNGPAGLPRDFVLDLAPQLQDCDLAMQMAQKSAYPNAQVQALMYKAHLCAIRARFVVVAAAGAAGAGAGAGAESSANTSLEVLQTKRQGYDHLDLAREVVDKHESLSVLNGELASVRAILDNDLPVPATKEELRAAFEAMAGDVGSGTGHWYTCVNGHYFTIGECGRPMQESRCPDCGANIGGRNHNAVDGVAVAEAMEELGRRMEGLGRAH